MSESDSHPVALVTGSGRRRVGWHVALALAERGFRIAIHYRSSRADANEAVEFLRAGGTEAIAFRADLTDDVENSQLIDASFHHYSRLDVLVNCAAIWEPKRLEDVTASDVRRHFEANVLGTFLCAQRAGLVMVGQEQGGCIINLGDWADARPYPNYAAYFASKGAIPTLTRCLAVELGLRNPRVRVNAILPGPVMLPPELSETVRREAITATLAQREGRPENVALAVLALVENDYITGTCLTVDGGRTIFTPDDRVWRQERPA